MNGKAMIVCMSQRTCLCFTTESRACAPTDIVSQYSKEDRR